MNDRTAFTVPPGFPEPLMRTARVYVDQSLSEAIDDDGVAWLYDHPTLWLTALVEVRDQILGHIAKQADDLRSREPAPGEKLTFSYLRRKREVAEANVRRRHMLEVLREYINDVKSLVDPVSVDLADAVERLATIIALCKKDEIGLAQQAAEELLANWTAVPAVDQAA